MKSFFYKTLTAISILFVFSSSANALMIGDSVSASWSDPLDVFNSITNFSSPAVIGSGVEFSGGAGDTFDQQWNFELDLDDNTFSLYITESNLNGYGNIWTANPSISLFNIAITDFDFTIKDVTLLSYVTNYPDPSVSNTPGLNGLLGISSGNDSIDLSFNKLLDTDFYTFSVTPVPEPSTFFLLGGGLAGLVFVVRRRKKE